MTEWISVKDRLPPFCEDVLVKYKRKIPFYNVARYLPHEKIWENNYTDLLHNSFLNNHGRIFFIRRVRITHWMPLPQPPN